MNFFSFLGFFGSIALIVYAVGYKRSELPRESIVWPRKLGWTVLLALIGFHVFAFGIERDGIGKGLFLAILFASVVLTFEKSKRTWLVYVLASFGGLCGLLLAYRANDFVHIVNWWGIVLSFFGLLILHAVQTATLTPAWIVHMALRTSMEIPAHIPAFLRSLRTVHTTKHPVVLSVIKTMVATAVLLSFFIAILSGADAVFGQYMSSIRHQLFDRTAQSLIVVLIITFLLTWKMRGADVAPPRMTFLTFREILIPLLSLATLFAVFLFIQKQYLFGSHADFQALNITYSDYVRQGFIQLLIASFFAIIVCYAVILNMHNTDVHTEKKWLQAVNITLMIEVALLLASALKRDWMYMDMYGLTRVRIIGETFLVWLAGILFLIFLLNIWKTLRERHVTIGALFLSAAVVFWLNGINMDGRIASASPPQGHQKDRYYISQLSVDAAPAWQDIVQDTQRLWENLRQKKEPLSSPEQEELVDAMLAINEIRSATHDLMQLRNWRDFNASEAQAYSLLVADNSQKFTDTVDCLYEQLGTYRYIHLNDLFPIEMRHMYEFRYPFVQGHNAQQYYQASDSILPMRSCMLSA